MLKPILLTCTFFVYTLLFAQSIELCDTNTFVLGEGVILSKTSFRGLSVVDDQTIWASGSRGTIARSTDGGKTFVFTQLKGYEKSDFRDIEAFDDQRAVIMSSGTPAYILQTNNGGKTWEQRYASFDSAIFLDAMDFWDDQNGMIIGDPVNGHFLLMQTNNGGENWKHVKNAPQAAEGEAVFAASGTSLQCFNKHDLAFVTGGKTSNMFHYDEKKKHWKRIPSGLISGKPSQGAFSFFATSDIENAFLVGGDYMIDTSDYKNYSVLGAKHNKLMKLLSGMTDYRSCVAVTPMRSVLVCGTTGVASFDILNDSPKIEWTTISTQPFNVVKSSKKGKAVFLAGPKGRIAKLVSK